METPKNETRILLICNLIGRLTVRLLVPGTGTWTTKLLWLASPVVGNEESTVVLGQGLLELVLGVLIDVLLVVGNEGLCDGC